MVPISDKHPVIGWDIFTTQAGIHQTGVGRQQKAEGGLIYLPFDPELVGRTGAEATKIGSLAGMDGIVSVLNRAVQEKTGQEGQYTNTSRVVKHIYDRVHDAYDGAYDQDAGRYVNCRTTFFDPREIVAMAEEYQAQHGATAAARE